MLFGILLIFVAFTSFTECTKLQSCIIMHAELPDHVEVPGCEKGPCEFKQDEPISEVMSFSLRKPVTSVFVVTADYNDRYDNGSVRASIYQQEQDICRNITGGCPIPKFQTTHLRYEIPPPPHGGHAIGKRTIEFGIVDSETRALLACNQFDLVIKPSKS